MVHQTRHVECSAHMLRAEYDSKVVRRHFTEEVCVTSRSAAVVLVSVRAPSLTYMIPKVQIHFRINEQLYYDKSVKLRTRGCVVKCILTELNVKSERG